MQCWIIAQLTESLLLALPDTAATAASASAAFLLSSALAAASLAFLFFSFVATILKEEGGELKGGENKDTYNHKMKKNVKKKNKKFSKNENLIVNYVRLIIAGVIEVL